MKRGKFSLSHYKLLTCKMGFLIPISWFEALPGDTIQQASSALIRCAPMLAPVMHPVHARIHHFFVPNRLIWANWESFITGGPDGMDATVHPYVTHAGAGVSSLYDYMGWPTSGVIGSIQGSALPFRAYNLIWNEFYRDQDLQTPLSISTGDGSDTTTTVSLQSCAWEKDYFTSARPWEQKGPAVTLPLGTTAPVVSNSQNPNVSGGTLTNVGLNALTSSAVQTASAPGATTAFHWGNQTGMQTDLSSATSVDVNTVREAFALQRFEEARARYGSRYTEYLRYLGVRSSDARLQRPEYLGGGRQTIQFSEVLQTAPATGGSTPLANLAGHGIGAMRSNRYRRFFEEHGIVMSLLSVRPRTMYSQGMRRSFFRGQSYHGFTGGKEDYWQRELQHIGQQVINGLEVDSSCGDSAFGYQDRYDEYRRLESSVAGEFRNSTLDYWHLAREFSSAPALNSTFVSCAPSTRIFADLTDDNMYIMANHSIQARRLLTQTGTSMTF